MPRNKKKSVKAGCGYRANVSSGKVTIYPTRNNKTCSVTLGLGDATFTFDPNDPPDTIKRIITKDSDGRYTPQILPIPNRSVKIFTSVEDINETFTDADGNTTDVHFKRLNGFRIDNFQSGLYIATGVNNISGSGSKLANHKTTYMFSGSIPYNLEFTAIQLLSIRGGYAYLDSDGYVNVVRDSSGVVARFNMGDNYIKDKIVTEFTVTGDSKTFICRNIDGYAIEVYCPFSYSGYFLHKNIHENVIRVASGRILKQQIDGVVEKSILTDDGYAIAIGENDVIDIVPNGGGGVKEIKPGDGSNKYTKVVFTYRLDVENNLYNNDKKIASNIYGLGVATQESMKSLTLGKDGDVSDAVKLEAINIFKSLKVDNSWIEEYIKWYSEQSLPTCLWAGVHDTNTTTKTTGICTSKPKCVNNYAIGQAIVAIDVDGKVFKLNGDILEEQPVLELDDKAFNAINRVSLNGKIVSFKHSTNKFRLPDVDVAMAQDNHFFKF